MSTYLNAWAMGQGAFHLQHRTRDFISHGNLALVVVCLVDSIVLATLGARGGCGSRFHGLASRIATTQSGHQRWLRGGGGGGSSVHLENLWWV